MRSPLRLVILKVASRCNLNCLYCYVYNKGDESWRDQPALMTDETFRASVRWMERQLRENNQEQITLLFHGGEPLLLGVDRFDGWCREASDAIGRERVRFAVQTNGVLINRRWCDVFIRHGVSVGVSLDGPEAVNDELRVDVHGNGSYLRVREGIHQLRDEGVPWSVLSVVNLGHDPLGIHRHLLDDIGTTNVDYLIPDHTHETIQAVRSRYGATPVSDWLIPIFDDWWARDSIRVRVRIFDAMVGSILRSRVGSVQFGNPPFGYLVVESDGTVEALDVLKICGSSPGKTGLTVRSPEPVAQALPSFLRAAVFEGLPLPDACEGCREAATCAGGWLPHRFSRAREFNNPSAWCSDLYKLFGHVRSRVRPESSQLELHRVPAADPLAPL